MLGFNTGLRPSELFHLEGRDVDLAGKPVHVRRKPELGFDGSLYPGVAERHSHVAQDELATAVNRLDSFDLISYLTHRKR